jgi:hypothetical protein
MTQPADKSSRGELLRAISSPGELSEFVPEIHRCYSAPNFSGSIAQYK